MKTSSFLRALGANPTLPLVFRAGREIVSPGYHLTEVKRVAYETMDCGAVAHRWSETQFEIWVPPSSGTSSARGHMPAGKFLRIIDRVEAELPLQGDAAARIHASFHGQPAALFEIDMVVARDGQLWIELGPDRTRCTGADRRGAAATGECCAGNDSAAEETDTAGGCGSARTEKAAAACCA